MRVVATIAEGALQKSRSASPGKSGRSDSAPAAPAAAGGAEQLQDWLSKDFSNACKQTSFDQGYAYTLAYSKGNARSLRQVILFGS